MRAVLFSVLLPLFLGMAASNASSSPNDAVRFERAASAEYVSERKTATLEIGPGIGPPDPSPRPGEEIRVSGPSHDAIRAEWVARIKSAPDHKVMAFRLGPELARLEPDLGFSIAEAVWPRIDKPGVKTGVLKAFNFSRHPRLLAVLNLGMTDRHPEVRRYAEAYLRPIALRVFGDDADAYRAWYAEFGQKPIETILEAGYDRLAEELRAMDAASGVALLAEIGGDFGAADWKTTYRSKKEYVRDSGLPEILLGWLRDAGASDETKLGILAMLARMQLGREFLEREMVPIARSGIYSVFLRKQAIDALGAPDNDWAIPILLAILSEATPDEGGDRGDDKKYEGREIQSAIGSALSRIDLSDDQVREIAIPLLDAKHHAGLRASAAGILARSALPEKVSLLADLLRKEYAREEAGLGGTALARAMAPALAETGDPKAIPILIGAIDSDNSYDTIYGVGYFGLGFSKIGALTGVEYSPYHDGAWWRRWWEKNRSRFPEEAQRIPIPDFPKTESGKKHVPFPEDIDTFEGRVRFLREEIRRGRLAAPATIWNLAGEFAEEGDPRAIPILIGVIDADNTYSTVYGVGHFGLGMDKLGNLTGVRYDASHNGAWWRAWWDENKSRFPKEAQATEIPDFSMEFAEGRAAAKALKAESALDDVADVPSTSVLVAGDPRKRYFLIGPVADAKPPADGFGLVVVMPGGPGGEGFNPFVRRILRNALGPTWVVAQPVAFKWHPWQKIVWPTKRHPAFGQQFSTEELVEAVIADVKTKRPIDAKKVVTLTWSSSGPAAYAVSLQPQTAVTGSFIAMSVFRTEWLPPLDAAKGRKYYLHHSPDDAVCPYSHAEAARDALRKAGAQVELSVYEGGHGWRGDLYTDIRRGVERLAGE